MTVDPHRSLQDQFAPQSICFGCGPANRLGLQLKSYLANRVDSLEPDGPDASGKVRAEIEPSESPVLVANFSPQLHHCAFEGIVNGGIISVLLDCHLNWTGAIHLMQREAGKVPPGCVTAKYEVEFKAPTPLGVPLRLEARVVESTTRRAVVSGVLGPVDPDDPSGQTIGAITATGLGTFVAVKPGHPAYHRW